MIGLQFEFLCNRINIISIRSYISTEVCYETNYHLSMCADSSFNRMQCSIIRKKYYRRNESRRAGGNCPRCVSDDRR